MPDIEVEVIQPREPSVEFIRDMIQDADDMFTKWIETKPTVEEKYIWIRQQLLDLILVNKMLRNKEAGIKCGNHKLGCDCTNWDEYTIDKERERNNVTL